MRFIRLLVSKISSGEFKQGRVVDISILEKGNKAYIQNARIKFQGKKPEWFPASHIDFQNKLLRIDKTVELERSSTISIKKNIWFRQGIDLKRRRIVRPYDFFFTSNKEEVELVSVLYGFPGKKVLWSDFLPIYPHGFDKILKLHPADVADILEHVSIKKQVKVLSKIPISFSSFVLSEMDTKRQAFLLDLLNLDMAVKMLVNMPRNHAANILRDVGEAKKYLSQMNQKTEEEISMLLSYDPDAVGGLMDSEFIKLKENFTCEEAIKYLRELSSFSENIYYLYVTDSMGVFKGVLTIRSLLLAEPLIKLNEIMKTKLISIPASTTREEIAQIMSRYHLLALPVVDEVNRIVGVIKIHDVLESTLEYPV